MDNGGELAAVQAFLREHITSYEQLESLLLLRRDAERACSAEDVASALRVPQAAAMVALEHLRRIGLFDRISGEGGPTFRFRPRGGELAAAVERLAQAYEAHRTGVMKLMNDNAIARVRARAMRAFVSGEPGEPGEPDAHAKSDEQGGGGGGTS